jgi:hypothetical protein
MGRIGPIWFNEHGINMHVIDLKVDGRRVVIGTKAAKLEISLYPNPVVPTGWLVEWEVKFSQSEHVNGRFITSSDRIRRMFGIDGIQDRRGVPPKWMVERYGIHDGVQGVFGRWNDFLNVPCPGTGHDGDPNISIQITKDMKVAIQVILG